MGEKEVEVELMGHEAVKAWIGGFTPAQVGRFVRSVQGNLDGEEEFPDLWPSLVALSEDEKTEIRLSVGFEK